MPEPLLVEQYIENDVLLLVLKGELDIYTGQLFQVRTFTINEEECSWCCVFVDFKEVHLDLSGITHLSAQGLSALLRLQNESEEWECLLKIKTPSRVVLRLIDMARCESRFVIET